MIGFRNKDFWATQSEVSILATLAARDMLSGNTGFSGEGTELSIIFGKTTLGVTNDIMFPISWSISFWEK